MLDHLSDRMNAKASVLLLTIDTRLHRILQLWLLVVGMATMARIAFSSSAAPVAGLSTVACYMLVIVAPLASTLLALHWFRDGDFQPQPVTRMARVGRWRNVSRAEAQSHRLYGTSGIMVSLLVGMMLNVPIRAAEYLVVIPPMPVSAPGWFSALHFTMTLDAILFSSLYMIAFVAALRRVPLFPRFLVAIWMADLAMQLVTAKLVADAGPLPPAVSSALHSLLDGNINKVLISMALWLPYLLLSTRVNVTYRQRIPA